MTICLRFQQPSLVILVGLLTLGAVNAHAQMLGDTGLGNALTSSLLQTTQQRQGHRHKSTDPYMALIKQSDPDRYLRGLVPPKDPLAGAFQSMLSPDGAASGGSVGVTLQHSVGLPVVVAGWKGEALTSGGALAHGSARASSISTRKRANTPIPAAMGRGCSTSHPDVVLTQSQTILCR
jgi:hypothetical protein